MKKLHLACLFLGTLILAAACKRDTDFNYYYYEPADFALLSQYLNLPDRPENYQSTLPKHLQSLGLAARPVDYDKATLGRVLFYDKNLSKDGTISCASCHKQELAFSDDKKVSAGVFGLTGDRNSIALGSVLSFSAYYGTDLFGPSGVPFFWDNRANTAAEQNLASMTNPNEMGMSHTDIVNAVQTQPYYEPLFRMAFGSNQVTQARVSEAIAEFVNGIGSYKSKFDSEAEKTLGYNTYSNLERNNFSGFSAAENRGKLIYLDNCASCHSPLQGRPEKMKANNGLDAATVDAGVGGVTNQANDMAQFKVPTLRNIELTGPYMHDGRFATLEEVVEHYSTGIQNHPNLSPELKYGYQPKKLNFSAQDKSDLVAFLKTLTDQELRTDKRYANPFK
ncbi:MAG: cytochrome c peroxidase [Saprospiraceae bacterium]|nr:c-type cytochrome [Lewinellaceae bacterium]